MRRKKRIFNTGTEVRKLARERVGTVKPSRPIEPGSVQAKLKKPKHKKPAGAEDGEA